MWGMTAQFVTIVVGIIIPRLVLVNLGSESNGLLNSVSSMLTYMSLLEAGVGTATLQALYKPFAESDRKSINEIMSATHYFYKRTGYVYLFIVLALSVIYTLFVKTSIPKVYVFGVIIISGLSGVMSYFFQGKFKILLAAEGKSYVTTNITTMATVGVSISKVIVLQLSGNIVILQTVYFVFNLLQMIAIALYMRKYYSWLDFRVTPNFKAISQKNAVLVHQVTELIFNNTDALILTMFTTLKTVSVYSMYAMIFGMVKSVTITISDSFLYALGQAYSDKEKFEKMHNAYEVYNMAFTFAIFCITGLIILPFLKLYTAGITDINYIDSKVAILFMLFYLLANGRKSSQVVINIAQEFDNTKWRSVIEAIINLSLSIILTTKFGIYGVLLGTIAALLYRANDVILYAAKLLEKSPLVTYGRWIRNFCLVIVFMLIQSKMTLELDSYFKIMIYGGTLCAVVIPSFIGMNIVCEPQTFNYMYSLIRNVLFKEKK